jgi:hypothetical protein
MAAALGLYLSLKKTSKPTVIASPTNPIVEVASLVGIDKVQTSLGGDAGDLVVSFPYEDGEIDKVSYTLENGQLNIVVKAGEKGLSFNDQDVRFTRGSGVVDLVFAIGTPRLADFGTLLDQNRLTGVKVVNVDNKSDNQRYGDILLVDAKASSVSEQVAEILLELGFNFDLDAAQNLLSGMVDATQNFTTPNSSALAFEMAGIMMQKGATRVKDGSASSFLPRKTYTEQAQQAQAPQPSYQPQPTQFQPQFQPAQPVVNQPFPSIQQPVEPVQPYSQPVQTQPQEQFVPQQPTQVIQQQLQDEAAKADKDEAPVDWLSPKVYKGSTNV